MISQCISIQVTSIDFIVSCYSAKSFKIFIKTAIKYLMSRPSMAQCRPKHVKNVFWRKPWKAENYNDDDWPCCPRRLGPWPCCWSFNLGQLLLTLSSLRLKCICQLVLRTRMTCKFTCIDHEIDFIAVTFKHLPYFHCQELVPLSLEESRALCQFLWVNLEIKSKVRSVRRWGHSKNLSSSITLTLQCYLMRASIINS